jgi:hypothetical protein
MRRGLITLGLVAVLGGTAVGTGVFSPEEARAEQGSKAGKALEARLSHPFEGFAPGVFEANGDRNYQFPVRAVFESPYENATLEAEVVVDDNVVYSVTQLVEGSGQHAVEFDVPVSVTQGETARLDGRLRLKLSSGNNSRRASHLLDVTVQEAFADFSAAHGGAHKQLSNGSPIYSGLELVDTTGNIAYVGPADEGQRGRWLQVGPYFVPTKQGLVHARQLLENLIDSRVGSVEREAGESNEAYRARVTAFVREELDPLITQDNLAINASDSPMLILDPVAHDGTYAQNGSLTFRVNVDSMRYLNLALYGIAGNIGTDEQGNFDPRNRSRVSVYFRREDEDARGMGMMTFADVGASPYHTIRLSDGPDAVMDGTYLVTLQVSTNPDAISQLLLQGLVVYGAKSDGTPVTGRNQNSVDVSNK